MEYSKLLAALAEPKKTGYPVILPDFFVDHFVKYENLSEFIDGLQKLAAQGGGNLLGSKQFLSSGGNCVNTATALLRLGMDPRPIVTTDERGDSLLRALADPGLNLDNVHTDGRLSSTVSIETEHEGRRINLMISDSGSASKFGFTDLTEDDLECIRCSALVALVNLNHNELGSALARGLFEFVRDNTDAITFMDMGDPSSRPDLVRPLIDEVVSLGLVDVLGVNENEVAWLVRALDGGGRWLGMETQQEMWLDAAAYASSELGTRLDLHTPFYAASVFEDEVVGVPAIDVDGHIALGAGDAWNAGNIWALLNDLDTESRLLLANTVAALYVSSKDAQHPTNHDVAAFLRSRPMLSSHGKKLLKLG